MGLKSYLNTIIGSNIEVEPTYDNLLRTSTKVEASGGTITTPGNGYIYHTFTSPGSFQVRQPGVIEVLVVAGGGGGGQTVAGGGGAGGIVLHTQYPVIANSYNVTVGSGGTGAVGSPTFPVGTGTSGGNSVFENITAIGGGGGGNYGGVVGPGGSAGGRGGNSNGIVSGIQTTQLQPGVPPGFIQYGNAGGESPNTNIGGAGGGAGSAANGPTAGSGQPFVGFSGPLIGIPALEPLNGFYGGGGGGGGRNPGGVASPGGSGGGGDGGNGAAGTPGVQYSGGGGGGGGYQNSPAISFSGGAGGPGIIVVRYKE